MSVLVAGSQATGGVDSLSVRTRYYNILLLSKNVLITFWLLIQEGQTSIWSVIILLYLIGEQGCGSIFKKTFPFQPNLRSPIWRSHFKQDFRRKNKKALCSNVL